MASPTLGPGSGIIVTRTPLRVSFAGGGTDLPAFYEREYGGVLSTTIDKYLYVTVKRHGDLFGERVRLNYSATERVATVDKIDNAIARECLRLVGVEPPIYISTVADLPGSSGLGSSSSFAVGLLNALHAYQGEFVSAGQLAREAAHVEIDVLHHPIGKQDQYAAAFGGLNFFQFNPGGSVTVEPHPMSNGALDRLFKHALMFWTGLARDSGAVLAEQRKNTAKKMADLRAMREHGRGLQRLLGNGFDPEAFGGVLDETWRLKRKLASRISNHQIDTWYARARDAGAFGGKLCGAGGGGFLLYIVPPDRQNAVRQAMDGLKEIPIRYEAQGSRLLFPLVG